MLILIKDVVVLAIRHRLHIVLLLEALTQVHRLYVNATIIGIRISNSRHSPSLITIALASGIIVLFILSRRHFRILRIVAITLM